ncbi:MAG: Ig-like domain-containing protein [Muribaculaceae bacterium]|nr:Ig-like domain-containing protein [Muribaculaceae bacterium]
MIRTLLSIAAIAAGVVVSHANDYTFIFDGKNDAYGLTRQTTTDPTLLTFVQEISVEESGVQLAIKKQNDEGRGFALVNAGGSDAGIMVFAEFPGDYSAIYPEITLTVPGGSISAAKIYMSGPGLLSMDIPFNGMRTEPEQEGNLCYWAWYGMDAPESLVIKWDNTFFTRYIHSIELTYSPNLGGKKASGLSFSPKAIEVVMGESFSAPELSNPHNLPVAWSSSDPEVATVDEEGRLTLLSGGKTMISVATEGDETYARGNAKYDLTVVPSASDIPQLLEYAGAMYDRVMVNFPATVMYGNSYFAYVADSEGNAACFENVKDAGSTSAIATIYSPGDVIPGGWIASNYTVNQSVSWQGIPPAVKETVEVKYPEVDSVTPADADKVVTLMGVTFTTSTPSGYEKAYGTTSDGTEYEFQDLYGIGSKAAGEYDVTGVVRYSKSGSREYFFIAPISYAKSATSGISGIEASKGETRWLNLQGVEVADPESGIYLKVSGGEVTKVVR